MDGSSNVGTRSRSLKKLGSVCLPKRFHCWQATKETVQRLVLPVFPCRFSFLGGIECTFATSASKHQRSIVPYLAIESFHVAFSRPLMHLKKNILRRHGE
jgi:hypothetical protein